MYLNLRNLLAVALFIASFSSYSGAAEVMLSCNDENFDPRPQCPCNRKPLSSKNNSPCKMTPPSSPEKKNTTLSSGKRPAIRKLFPDAPTIVLGIPTAGLDEPANALDQSTPSLGESIIILDRADENKNFMQALSISRQKRLPEFDKHKGSYLCALLDHESNMSIESALNIIFQKKIESSNIQEVLKNRSPFTVFNLSLNCWPVERLYHMSLGSKMTKGMEQGAKERLKSILKNVEFGFSKIEIMKRFIAIKLTEPTIKKNCKSSDEDIEFLKNYLEYDGKTPCMHISLMMVNSFKDEMKCISMQEEKIKSLIPNGLVDYKITKLENISSGFRPNTIKSILLKFYLSYLFVISKETRDYVSMVLEVNKGDLYPLIYNQAQFFQHSMPDFSESAQLYFRENYGLDYDFKGKIFIGMKDVAFQPLDQTSINRLFSKIFLLGDDTDNQSKKSFINFQKVTDFYIESTLRKIKERESEIKNGRTVVGDVDSFDMFDTPNQELSLNEKIIYEKNNESDLLKIKELEKNIALHLIMNRFFGLSLDISFFDKFCDRHSNLISDVINYDPTKGIVYLNEILSALDEIIPEAVRENFLDQKYEIKNDFGFIDIFNVNVMPYICFVGNIEEDIREKIVSIKNEKVKKLDESRGNLYQIIEFSNSKIQNPIFWHKFWHILEEELPRMLQGKKFSFSELSAQAVDEEDHGDII